ncbi:sodium:solute symporter [Rhodococcus sp. NPDC060176]|uniref:sodium:solute symporter family protein n=1 Tax=Rhodococcus sp. NPDC060176 TaxID=3347062 RepID=UPI0036489D18
MIATISFAGIIILGLLGMYSRSAPKTLANWTVSERNIPRWTSWFLQAGESLTTFAFLGLAGVTFVGGSSAVFAVAYLSLSAIGLYFVAPRIRSLAAARGFITQADFFTDRFSSPGLGKTVAAVGVLSLLPYLQLQITGLGLIVQLVTGSESARGLSMVVASLIIVLFVTRSGIRGIARVAYVKDVLMVLALGTVAGGVLVGIGGVPDVFARVAQSDPLLLTLGSDGYDTTFFVTAVVITSLAASFNTFPHLWPPVLAAESGAVLRSNYKWLALYQLVLLFPIFIGFAAILTMSSDSSPNKVMLSVTSMVLPDWLVGVVAVAGASAAMVPAAAISMGISTAVTRNLLSIRDHRVQLRANHAVVIAAVLCALGFGLRGPDITDLLLLTYSGLAQLVPATAIGLAHKVRAGAVPVMVGIATGLIALVMITFLPLPIGSWDSGLVALGPNILALVCCELLRRFRRPTRSAAMDSSKIAA